MLSSLQILTLFKKIQNGYYIRSYIVLSMKSETIIIYILFIDNCIVYFFNIL